MCTESIKGVASIAWAWYLCNASSWQAEAGGSAYPVFISKQGLGMQLRGSVTG